MKYLCVWVFFEILIFGIKGWGDGLISLEIFIFWDIVWVDIFFGILEIYNIVVLVVDCIYLED